MVIEKVKDFEFDVQVNKKNQQNVFLTLSKLKAKKIRT